MAADSLARFSDEAAVPSVRTESARPALDFFCAAFETVEVAWSWRGGGMVRDLFCFASERRKAKEGKEKRRGSLPVEFSPGGE